MPGSVPATSQLDWLSSTTAMIVLFWSRATRDLLKSFGWGIAALHRLMQRRSCHVPAARPIASIGPGLVKGLSAVVDERCRTDKLDGVIKHRSSRETTMVGRGASLDGRHFLGRTAGSNPSSSSGE